MRQTHQSHCGPLRSNDHCTVVMRSVHPSSYEIVYVSDVDECFSTGVPRSPRVTRVAARGSAKTDGICLGRNSQPQLIAI